MTADTRLWILTLLVLAIGTAFTLLRAAGADTPILSGREWAELVTWLVGLHATGAAGLAIARPAGEALRARVAARQG